MAGRAVSGTGLFDRSFRPVFYASWLQPVKTAVLTGDRQLASSAVVRGKRERETRAYLRARARLHNLYSKSAGSRDVTAQNLLRQHERLDAG